MSLKESSSSKNKEARLNASMCRATTISGHISLNGSSTGSLLDSIVSPSCRTNKEFQQTLREKNKPTTHQKNLQVLITELYNTVNGMALPIMNLLFNFYANIHNIRNFLEIFTEKRKTVKCGIETVTYRAPFLWANP